MKTRLVAATLSLIILIVGSVCFLWYHNTIDPQMPLASADGGYYDEPFLLRLTTAPGNTIYYTTDGSAPSLNSQVYEDGILIEDRSQQENIYHNIQNVIKNWLLFPADTTPVPKGTVVRAISVDRRGFISDVFTQTYFVGMEPPSDGYALSLIFEPEDMFGDDGIYVTGKEYDAWYLSENRTGDAPQPNFEKRIEIPVLMELMDEDGDVINQKIGARIQGASSRQDRHKRLILVAREEYSGSKVFDEKLFGVNTHSVMLKPSLIDAMAHDLVSDRAVATQKSEQVDVYLNGEFWYTTYMLERYDGRYYEEYYGAEEVVEVEDSGDMVFGIDALPTYMNFRDWLKDADWTNPSNWELLQAQMDVQSFIDYYAINYYLGNIDVTEWRNYRLWRAADVEINEKYRDTRWKWQIYDVDSMTWAPSKFDGIDIASANTFFDIGTHTGMPMITSKVLTSLLNSPSFREQFALSFMDIVNNNFAVERVEKILGDYGVGLDYLDGYFMKRPTYAPQHLAELLDLQGTLESVSITTTKPSGGSVTVNTSQIDLDDGQWEGTYFTDYPITVTATPKRGYKFVGWKGAVDTAEATITLPVDGGIVLDAVFEPLW